MSAIASQLEAGRAQLEAEKTAGLALLHAKQSAVAAADPQNSRMRSFIAHAADERLTTDFLSYHCACCSQYALIIDAPLSSLPARHSDAAAIVVRRRRTVRLKADHGDVRAIRRERGVEKQWRWACRQCKQPIAYQSEPWQDRGSRRSGGQQHGAEGKEKEGDDGADVADLLYIMKGALVGFDEEKEAEMAERQEAEAEEEETKGDEEERRGARGLAGSSKQEEEEEIEKVLAELRRQEAEEDAPPSAASAVAGTDSTGGSAAAASASSSRMASSAVS